MDSVDTPELEVSFDQADAMLSSVSSEHLFQVNGHSDNSRLQLASSFKFYTLCYNARALLLPVPQVGKMSAGRLIHHFSCHPATFRFKASLPPGSTTLIFLIFRLSLVQWQMPHLTISILFSYQFSFLHNVHDTVPPSGTCLYGHITVPWYRLTSNPPLDCPNLKPLWSVVGAKQKTRFMFTVEKLPMLVFCGASLARKLHLVTRTERHQGVRMFVGDISTSSIYPKEKGHCGEQCSWCVQLTSSSPSSLYVVQIGKLPKIFRSMEKPYWQ